MLTEQIVDILHSLRLTGMAQAIEEQRGIPDIQSLAFEERFALLLERERGARENRRLSRLLQLARFRLAACVEDVNFRAKRGLDRSLVLRLATCEWIRAHSTLLMTGPTGTGKTFLACALGCTRRAGRGSECATSACHGFSGISQSHEATARTESSCRRWPRPSS